MKQNGRMDEEGRNGTAKGDVRVDSEKSEHDGLARTSVCVHRRVDSLVSRVIVYLSNRVESIR